MKRIDWHAGFVSAMKLEFLANIAQKQGGKRYVRSDQRIICRRDSGSKPES